MCPVQGHNAVRLEPATPLPQVKHFTTEPLPSFQCFVNPDLGPNCQKSSADEISRLSVDPQSRLQQTKTKSGGNQRQYFLDL